MINLSEDIEDRLCTLWDMSANQVESMRKIGDSRISVGVGSTRWSSSSLHDRARSVIYFFGLKQQESDIFCLLIQLFIPR